MLYRRDEDVRLLQDQLSTSRAHLSTSLRTIGIPFRDLSSDPTPAPVGWDLLHRPSAPLLKNNPSSSQSLCLPLDQGIPLPYPSPPLSPSPLQMVAWTKKSYKKRKDQRCRPRDKSQQVRMSLKLSVAKLQDKYGLSLVQDSLEQVLEEIREGSAHDTVRATLPLTLLVS